MHILSPETDNCPFWISGRERITVEKISWSISTKECCRSRRGLNPRPPGLQSDGASNWATEAGLCSAEFAQKLVNKTDDNVNVSKCEGGNWFPFMMPPHEISDMLVDTTTSHITLIPVWPVFVLPNAKHQVKGQLVIIFQSLTDPTIWWWWFSVFTSLLTHCSLEIPKGVIDKWCRSRSDAAVAASDQGLHCLQIVQPFFSRNI